MTTPAETLAEVGRARDRQVGPLARRALAALVFASVFGGAHVARLGTNLARGAALGLFACAVAIVVASGVVAFRARRDPRSTVRRTISKVDPELGERTLRALNLVERTRVDETSGSLELAELHLRRLVGGVSRAALAARAGLTATRWATFGAVVACVGLATVAFEPFRIVEGGDVLAARGGEAPLPLAFLDEVEMSVAPPDYLHLAGGSALPFSPVSVPRGTILTVRGRPIRPGRALVLTDGSDDVHFVDDGSGGVLARWSVGPSTTLFVAARFGNVHIRQADEQPVTSIPDEAPKVIVEGAPRTAKLIDEPNIAIHYEASDDHGLREVDLVLRSGENEERRVLSRPSSDAKTDRGGYELRASDPFFKKTFAVTEITVEARDNDVVTGPKWGKSEAIILVPPEVGEPEALRFAALAAARNALTDLLADRLEQKPPAPGKALDHEKHETEVQETAFRIVEKALGQPHGGITLRGRFAVLARGQIRRLRKALDTEKKSPTAETHKKLIEETEATLLAFDAGLRGLGMRDSQKVARRLADVAEEVANTVANSEEGDKNAAKTRIDANITVLAGGGGQLLHLGDLGRDLGEIVGNDLRRIDRARKPGDMFHTELAARDLAARLRRPDPSFAGGGGHNGGVESGGSGQGEKGQPSDADDDAAAAERELDELTQDHQSELDAVENALDAAGSPEEKERFKEEAKEHAEAIREAIKKLPKQSDDAASAEAAASTGREEAEAMAGALEHGDASRAVELGKRAVQSLGEAKKLGAQANGFFPEQRAGREAAAARETVDRELAWTEDMLEKLRHAASARAKGDLDEHGKQEKQLGDRAKQLSKKGESGDGAMPQEMLDHLKQAAEQMREAERSLREGEGPNGVEHQREAQRLLEMAQSDRSEDPRDPRDNPKDSNDEGKKVDKRRLKIPGKDEHKDPQEFRKRVLDGLGGSSDPLLRDAVKRYAEGLLK